MNFDKIIDDVISREGGFTDHPSDRGGPTMYGITQSVARANGWRGDMRDLPLEFAQAIYLGRYITIPAFDKVAAVNERVGAELIDTGINMGPAVAGTMFQRWLNGLNLRGSRFQDVFVDGRIGPVTLDAFRNYMRWRGDEGAEVMVAALNGTQAVRYLEIAEANPSQESFLYGWLRSRVLQRGDD